MVLHKSIVDWRRGCGVSLPWVYVHSTICENCFGVVVLHRSIVDYRGVRSICHAYMCILLYIKHLWCSGVA